MKQAITAALVAATVAVTSAAVPAAVARENGAAQVTQSETVRIGDLDLARDSDLHTLYTRLRKAAVHVCTMGGMATGDLVDDSCPRRALDDAIASVANASLTALHEHRGPPR